MQLGKREKILAFAVGGLSLVLLLKMFIFAPVIEKISAAQQDVERSQLMIRKYLELSQHKETILKAQKQIERYMKLSGSDEEKMSAILSKIEQEARKIGIQIQDMNPTNLPKAKSMPVFYHVQLRAESDMGKLFTFIYNLENTDILFKVEKLTLTLKDEATGAIRMEASILAISLS
jgi:flagellar biosynthesis protein FliP